MEISTNNKTFTFDSSDLAGMQKLRKEFGNSDMPFNGVNENGEDVLISIFPDKIAVRTFQKNKWIRINTYYDDGNITEEFER